MVGHGKKALSICLHVLLKYDVSGRNLSQKQKFNRLIDINDIRIRLGFVIAASNSFISQFSFRAKQNSSKTRNRYVCTFLISVTS